MDEGLVVAVDVAVVVRVVVADVVGDDVGVLVCVVVGVVTWQSWNPPAMYASVITLMVAAASSQLLLSRKYLVKPHCMFSAVPAGPRNSVMALFRTPTVVPHDDASATRFMNSPLSSTRLHTTAFTEEEQAFSTVVRTDVWAEQS